MLTNVYARIRLTSSLDVVLKLQQIQASCLTEIRRFSVVFFFFFVQMRMTTAVALSTLIRHW